MAREGASANVRLSPDFFRSTPNSGHSEAHAGLPLLTRLGHSLPRRYLIKINEARRYRPLYEANLAALIDVRQPRGVFVYSAELTTLKGRRTLLVEQWADRGLAVIVSADVVACKALEDAGPCTHAKSSQKTGIDAR